ncbi:MAG: hypothetical protein IPJ31_06590 [Bacteroidetes bacterium]|nr:hypothetical protein [Bacteroidota bacterium]MBP6316106.1 hypothetical protein [Chitinophagaceae bacterium]
MRRKFFLIIMGSLFFSILCRAQTFTHNVDSFRTVIQEGFDFNFPIVIEDTFLFLKQGLYSMNNYDNTSTFNDIFMCYEPGYKKLPDPRFSQYRNTDVTMKRDIRLLFIYYLDQYLLSPHNNLNWVDKYSEISMLNLKTNKPFEIIGDKAFENVLEIYRKLIISLEKKEFKTKVLTNREMSMLEFIGYKWVIKNVEG